MAKPPPPNADASFIDAEGYMGSKDPSMTYEQIVLKQIQRCVDEGNKEMVGGHISEKQTSRGLVPVYVPDQRQVYIQCVNSFYDLMLPHMDDVFEDKMDGVELLIKRRRADKIESLKKNMAIEKNPKGRAYFKEMIDSGFIDRDTIEARQLADEMVEAYREVFQELILLYNRKRFLLAEAINE